MTSPASESEAVVGNDNGKVESSNRAASETNGQGRADGTARKAKPRRRHNNNSKSRSPTRKGGVKNKSKSRSPTRTGGTKNRNPANKSKSPTRRRHNKSKSRSPTRKGGVKNTNPAAMTVIVNRCDLWDSAAQFQPEEAYQPQTHHSASRVLPYTFVSGGSASHLGIDEDPPPSSLGSEKKEDGLKSVAVARVPHYIESIKVPVAKHGECGEGYNCDVIDTHTPNPHDPDVVHDKYWAQRR